MSEWLAIADWARCQEMSRPGIIFELRNAEGLSLFAPCSAALPAAPFDWTSPPAVFRAIEEPPAERSSPIPPPRG